jgi:thymidylate kinase
MVRPVRRLPWRDAVLAAILVLAATALLQAQDRIEAWTQDWVPSVLEVPADAILLTDREIGSTVRMFSFSTGADVDALFEAWEAALRDGGFPIDQGAEDLLERSIEFSGRGINNAKIVAGATGADGRTVIEVDATLQ